MWQLKITFSLLSRDCSCYLLNAAVVCLVTFPNSFCKDYISCCTWSCDHWSFCSFISEVNLWFLFFFFSTLFIYLFLFLAALGLCCCARAFSSCSEWEPLLAVVHGPLIAVAPPIAEHGLQARGLQQLWHAGSAAVARGLQSAGSAVMAHGSCCSAVCGILPDQGSNLCPLHWQVDFQPLCHQGSPNQWFLLMPEFHKGEKGLPSL